MLFKFPLTQTIKLKSITSATLYFPLVKFNIAEMEFARIT